MKKSSLEWTLLILITFIFWGANNIFPENFVLAVKAVCIVGACADVYFLAVSYEKVRSERQESFVEINRRVEEYLETFREEQQNLLRESNKKLGNLVEKMIKSEADQSQKYAAMTEQMAEKNGNLFESTMEGIRGFVQSERGILVTEQKRTEENEKLMIENLFAGMEKRGDEQKRQIEEYLKTLREEQQNILAESNEKLGNLVEKMIKSEVDQSQKYAAMTEQMTEKNEKLFEHTMEEIREVLKGENESRSKYFEELEQKLSANMQRMIDVQNKNMDTTAALLKSNEEAYGYSMNEIRKLSAIQEELVAKEIEVRDINEKILQDINTAMNGFVQVSGSVKDEVAALKAYMKVFKDKIDAKLEEHYEHMEDAVEDGNDELRNILEKSGKNQVNAFSDQTKELKECVAQIEDVVNLSISAVMERNDRLLLDLERMQDEWTNLNKTEIEFLNKIWEG